MPFNLSFGEIAVVLVVAILVFGGRLPDVARKVGKTITEFKRGMNDEFRNLDRAVETKPVEPAPPKPEPTTDDG